MKIFITGITGLLGRYVAELCVQNGHDIVALIRDRKINCSHFSFNLHISYGDLSNVDTLTDCIDNAEIIINCAADTTMLALRNRKQEDTNITGVKNLIGASKKASIKKFIHISSANTIASGDFLNPADESLKLKTDSYQLSYINSKIIGEDILLQEFKDNGFPVIILNPTFILGPKDYKVNSGKLILSCMKKQLPFYPKGGKNIVDVRDLAQAIFNSISKGNIGQNYILSNENLTYKELFSYVAEYANIIAPQYAMPNFLGNTIGYVGTCFELITGKSISINHKTIKLSFENHYYNSDKAKKELNFRPRSAKETIQDTVNWFLNEYK